MSIAMETPTVELVAAEHSDVRPTGKKRGWIARLWTVIVFAWKYFVGVVLTQTAFTSLLVIGWIYRLSQRAVLKQWWKASPLRRQGVAFGEFLAQGDDRTIGLTHWPNWIVAQNFGQSLSAVHQADSSVWMKCRGYVRVLLGSLGANIKLGVQGLFNTWVLTLPGCVLFLFSWYDGWNNSFHKGYEQALVGPLTGILGIVVFIAAMFYVPMAQARQAATGSWRAFYDFRLVARLVRSRWRGCIGIAAWYTALSLPVTILKIVPGFLDKGDTFPGFEEMTNAELHSFLVSYFLWSAVLFFPVYVWLRLVAAKVYASALLGELQAGRVGTDELGVVERNALEQLELTQFTERRRRHPLIRAAAGTVRTSGTVAVVLATAMLWFSFVSQIYVSQFLKYDEAKGWLNQPLVQLPWFNYIPGHLSAE